MKLYVKNKKTILQKKIPDIMEAPTQYDKC